MFRSLLILNVLFLCGALMAEDTTATTTTAPVTTAAVSTSDAKLIGEFEVRPSYGSKLGEVHTENTASLGYQFDAKTALDYTQYFNTNLSNPDGDTLGLNPKADDGMLRLKGSDVVKTDDTSVGLQTRVYLPTESRKRDAGLIFFWRNQITAAQKLNNAVSVDFTIAPYLHVYNRAGHKDSANPWFQQRFVLNADISITDKLTFSLPVIFDATKTRAYSASAANNDSWGYILWTWPELAYQVTDNFKVGSAWYSNNFLTDTVANTTTADGFETGVFQVFVNYRL